MMADFFRVKPYGRGIEKAALQSPEVRAMIEKYAEQVGDRARNDGEGHNVEVYHGGKDRARSYVWLAEPNSGALEAKDRILGRAIGRMGE
jgi:hypothetical protein